MRQPQSDRLFLQNSATTDDTLNEATLLMDSTNSGGVVSYNRFKNTAGVAQATTVVRKSLNEMT